MNVRSTAVSAWLFRLLAVGTVVYAMILVFATHHPNPAELVGDLAGDLVHKDKTLHFTAYGLLGLLVACTLAAAGRWSWRTLAVAMLMLAAFAALDEVTQPLFGRATELLDWVFDGLGLAAGVAAVIGARAVVGLLRR